MEGADGLQIIAEVSVGLAGFTGVVLALARGPGEWHPFDSLRIFGLLSVSLATVVLALLPSGLAYAGLDGPVLWRSSSAIAVVLLAPVVTSWALRTRRLAPEHRTAFRPWVNVFLHAIHAVALTLQALNALAIGFQGTLAPFYLALWLNVCFCAFGFFALVFRRPQP